MSTTSPLTLAPDFELPTSGGETRSLESLLGKGSLLLVFHRGTW
jgi:peroxiredoxin